VAADAGATSILVDGESFDLADAEAKGQAQVRRDTTVESHLHHAPGWDGQESADNPVVALNSNQAHARGRERAIRVTAGGGGRERAGDRLRVAGADGFSERGTELAGDRGRSHRL